MIFDEIVLHNFGVYRGRQSIQLAPPSADRPVVLFGGLNGAGKTTLLDALQLSLTRKDGHAHLMAADLSGVLGTVAQLVTVQPGHAVQASVRAQAQKSGQFVVFARIVDRNGQPFGPESEIIVRSTRFGRVALTVTVLAAAVLMVAAGVRITRRALASRS